MKLDIQLFGYYDGDVEIKVVADTKEFDKGLDKIQDSSKKAGSTIKNIVAGLGITSLIKKGFDVITSSIDDATKRFDTLNNFPKVMNSLGIASEDAEKSIKKMSDKLSGLPTTLDEGARAVQRFTAYNGDVQKSTDMFLAVNNAILAGGASAEAQASALEQLTQAYTKGKPEANDWKILMQAMPAQLKQVANSMGYASTAIGGDFYEALQKGEISMDDFMNTMIKLNKEGGDGFASFEKQARTGTEGIRTSIKVAKTQVVKGVADMITGMNKSLKKSNLPSLSEMIAKMGKEAKKVLDNVAKALSKVNFRKLIDTIKTLIPVVGTLTAGFIAYNAVLKAMEIGSAVVQFAKLTTTFISLIPALTSANAATVALNSTIAVSPIGILIASVAGLTTGLYLLQKASESNATSTQKITQNLQEYDKAMQEADKSRQKYLDTHMNEIKNTQDLAYELETLVDENGKVKEGYEDRVNFILGELNDALGTEIKMNNGVIEGYDGVRNSIAKVIEQKRANVLLDAEEEKYNKAKDRRNQLEADYYKAQENYNNSLKKRDSILKEIQKTYGLTNKQLEEVSQTLGYTDKNGQRVNLNFEELGKKLGTLNGTLETHKNTLNSTKESYENNEKTIANYEYALEQLTNGNYQAVEKMYEDTTNYHAKTKVSNDEAYKNEIDAQKSYLAELKSHKKDYEDDVYNQLVTATENRIKVLEDEQKKAQEKTKASQSTLSKTWKEGIDTQKDIIEKSRPSFEQGGSNNTLSYAKGIESKKGNVSQKSKEVGNAASSQLDRSGDAFGKGQNLTQGYINGIGSLMSSVRNAAANIANQAMLAVQQAQDSHSPSKKTKKFGKYFVDGYTLGIEENKDETINAVKSYTEDVLNELGGNKFNNALDDIYSSMQRAVDLETGKINANVELGTASKNLSQMISANATFDGTIEVQANIDGEKVWENQQKITQRKSLQYGGVR